ncbi:aminoglycoside adenylyltransferase family protein [Streptomyces albipurpureus]|uniref:Aminoglycoside adenylyltransferase family protein n=1 Tax=Streptomyces albipurpureus TaxID=2897419 RepID=A0ABT0UQY3_9ACTN|nr:aminoglycoside adenylyltransferase family protein [Streptomyces sp. CWNU-1]MCM2389666.1 aminoglycoside adenylyltransferase family protein [Streptomyces sp. CWNU-1]
MTQTEDVTQLVHRTLGTDVIGMYVHGSAVLGGLRPHSDIDVFVLVRQRTTAKVRRALVKGLLPLSGARALGGPARPVELTIAVQSDIRPWRYPPLSDFQYGEWLRDFYESGGTPSPTPDPDLALLITMVLLGDTPLAGSPPPNEVLDPVPEQDLIQALTAGVPGLLHELTSDTRNVVLTLARIWMTLTTGEITSKEKAADWALPRLPPGPGSVLAHAAAVYQGSVPESWDELLPQVGPYAETVAEAIGQVVAAKGKGRSDSGEEHQNPPAEG